MKKKKIVASLVVSSLFFTSLCGCGNNKNNLTYKSSTSVDLSNQSRDNIKELSGYLGGTYQQLVQKRGEGLDNVSDVEGKMVLDSTTYPIRMFNYDANLIFDLDDTKNINSITLNFKGVTPDELLENIKEELGNPSKINKNKKTKSKEYKWNYDKHQIILSQLGDETIISINGASI